jgi:hypothetical protein
VSIASAATRNITHPTVGTNLEIKNHEKPAREL